MVRMQCASVYFPHRRPRSTRLCGRIQIATVDWAVPPDTIGTFENDAPGLTDEYLGTAEEVPRRTLADPFSILAGSP
jgi:hypothetical protein